MKNMLLIAMGLALMTLNAIGQTTYVWNRTTSGTWSASGNWTPTRTNPQNNDIIVFNNGSVDTATSLASQTIGKLVVTGKTSILLQANNNRTLTIGGGTGIDLVVDAGSSLIVGGSNGLDISLTSGATAMISGAMVFTGAAHRLLPTDAGSVTFTSGGTLTLTSTFSGNPFGTSGTANAVILAAGSSLVSQGGSSPFGLTQPSSRVVFQAGSTYRHQQISTPDFSGRTYANFELNSSGVTLTPTGSSSLSIDTMTVTAGNLSVGITGPFSIKGSISVASGSALTFNPATSATLTFSGTSAQRVSGSGSVVFQNTQNVMVNGVGLIIDRNITIPGTVTLTSGNITLGAGNLALGGTISGAGAGKSIVTSGTGVLKRHISAGSQFQFPVSATGVDYTPLTIALSASDAADTFAVSVQTGVNPSAPNNQTAVQRTWTISETTGVDSNATLTFQWDASQEGTSFTRTAAGIWRYTGSFWIEPSGGMSLGSGPYTLSSILPLKAYGTYIIGNDGALPITLSSFRGDAVTGKGVCLTWNTISEIGNYGFEVERSSTLEGPYQLVSPIIPGHGTTNVPQSYSFTDLDPLSGTSYYRLKQTDLDQTIHYFESVAVTTTLDQLAGTAQKFSLDQNYPNPFNPETEIRFAVDQTGPATLVVYNSVGQVVTTLFDGMASAGQWHTVRFNGANCASGVYFSRLESAGKSDLRKMMLLR